VGGQRHATPRPLYPGKEPVPIVQEAGWIPEPVWTGTEDLYAMLYTSTNTGINSF